MTGPALPKAVLFDLLTALLDSWTLWNAVAGSESRGRAWRAKYLRLTYGCGAYVPYEKLVRDAARATGLPGSAAQALEDRWLELPAWSGAQAALDGRLQINDNDILLAAELALPHRMKKQPFQDSTMNLDQLQNNVRQARAEADQQPDDGGESEGMQMGDGATDEKKAPRAMSRI